MKKQIILIMIVLITCFAASSCTTDLFNAGPEGSESGSKDLITEITLQGRLFTMEIALNASQRAQGLMGRRELPDDQGMLFVFPDDHNYPREVAFWMKNCLIPIDVIFIDSRGQITAIHEMQPPLAGAPDDQLVRYHSNGPVQYAIEIRGGLTEELGLQVGNTLSLPFERLLMLAE